ncbi:MAG: FAD-dependent oxidoreductase [Pseudomonadota bacterium]
MKAVIVGAGIGGLTCALALRQRGHDVTVLEQAPQLGEIGAGITITPNADRVFADLGLSDRMVAQSVIPERQLTQHWQSGDIIRDVERGAATAQHYGAGYYHIHRADLHSILVDALSAAAPDSLKLATPVQDARPDGTVLTEAGTAVKADIVIGADGVKSQVRSRLFATEEPKFTGQVAWRGLVPRCSVETDMQPHFPGVHIGPKKLFMRYPVRAETLVNYAAFVELYGWQEESWTIPSSRAELLEHFAVWAPEVTALIHATPDDQLFKWALFVRAPLDTWINGRVTLLGDAAHAMLPFMGQGAATAIEDAMVLARALDAYPLDEALERYDTARRPRTSAIQENARLLGLQFQGEDPNAFNSGGIKNEEQLGLFDYDAVHVDI